MSLDISRIHALCFDVDGTLRDTDDQYVERFAQYFRLIKWFLPNRDPVKAARWFVMMVETPASFFFSIPDRLGLDDELASAGNWLHEKGIVGNQAKQYLVIPGVLETLTNLSGRFPMAAVSARSKRETEDFLEAFSLSHYFQVVVTAQTAHRTKPHPAPVHWAAEKMKVLPENCLMIGDTTVDILAGRRAGAQTLGVLSGFGQEDELLRVGANAILPNVAALPQLLSQN